MELYVMCGQYGHTIWRFGTAFVSRLCWPPSFCMFCLEVLQLGFGSCEATKLEFLLVSRSKAARVRTIKTGPAGHFLCFLRMEGLLLCSALAYAPWHFCQWRLQGFKTLPRSLTIMISRICAVAGILRSLRWKFGHQSLNQKLKPESLDIPAHEHVWASMCVPITCLSRHCRVETSRLLFFLFLGFLRFHADCLC